MNYCSESKGRGGGPFQSQKIPFKNISISRFNFRNFKFKPVQAATVFYNLRDYFSVKSESEIKNV